MDNTAVPVFRISILEDMDMKAGDELFINPKDLENIQFIESKDVSPQEIPYWAQ